MASAKSRAALRMEQLFVSARRSPENFMIKVGIVEDNKTVREGFETLLNRTPGFQCVCACATVGEALRKIPKAAPDVVLMDIQLPDATGVECAAKIKQLLPAVQIVIVTVYEDSER